MPNAPLSAEQFDALVALITSIAESIAKAETHQTGRIEGTPPWEVCATARTLLVGPELPTPSEETQ